MKLHRNVTRQAGGLLAVPLGNRCDRSSASGVAAGRTEPLPALSTTEPGTPDQPATVQQVEPTADVGSPLPPTEVTDIQTHDTLPSTAASIQESASVFFGSCNDARSAGAAPLQRGQRGYRDGLDRDQDGVACE